MHLVIANALSYRKCFNDLAAVALNILPSLTQNQHLNTCGGVELEFLVGTVRFGGGGRGTAKDAADSHDPQLSSKTTTKRRRLSHRVCAPCFLLFTLASNDGDH